MLRRFPSDWQVGICWKVQACEEQEHLCSQDMFRTLGPPPELMCSGRQYLKFGCLQDGCPGAQCEERFRPASYDTLDAIVRMNLTLLTQVIEALTP